MSGLCMIIETPRGGDGGHCFLTSMIEVSESNVTRTATAASKFPIGKTYISVSRNVTQRLPNGAVREGAERVILVGLDVGRLQPEQIEQVKAELINLFKELDNVIESFSSRSVNWSTVVYHHEIQRWVARDVFQCLPLAVIASEDDAQKSAAPRRTTRSFLNWKHIGVLVLICCGICWLYSMRKCSRQVSGDNSNQSFPEVESYQDVHELANEWHCTPDDLVRSLARASNWDRRREVDKFTLKSGMADGEVCTMFNRIVASKGADRFLVSPAINETDGFRRFADKFPLATGEEAMHLRLWFHSAWMKYNALKEAADKARSALIGAGKEDAFSRILVSISEVQSEVGLGDDFYEPVTPVFDRQDLMIYRVIDQNRQRFSDIGFEQEVNQGGSGGAPASNLAEFIRDVRDHHKEIHDSIAKSRAILTDAVHGNPKLGSKSADAVYDAYVAFEIFLEKLGEY